MLEPRYFEGDILTRDDGLEIKIIVVLRSFIGLNEVYGISRGKLPNDPDTRFMQFHKLVTGYDLKILKFIKL